MKIQSLYTYLFVSFLPVFLLAILFPQRLFQEPEKIEQLYSSPGADVVAFTQYNCPHCRKFKRFAIKRGWPVEYHDISKTEEQQVFNKLREIAPSLTASTPVIIINGKIIQGYGSDETTGAYLEQIINSCQKSDSGCLSFNGLLNKRRADVLNVQKGSTNCSDYDDKELCENDSEQFIISLWILGDVNLIKLSLPVLSILLGFLDGFNPCAMWVLVTLLTLLLALNDMRKMVVIGGTFLLVSAVLYYIFIAAWLNVFLLIGYNFWIQKCIGLVAVGAGGFYFYEAFGKDPNVCKVTDQSERQRIIQRMKRILQYSSWPLMLGGVSILAISVNMIELVCTAGLPAIFTQILAYNNVSAFFRYFYLFLYILLYMIDDCIIFIIALYTMQASGLTTKYRRITMIFGGALMYLLGILIIFFPDTLIVG